MPRLRVSPRLAGSSFYDRRRVEKSYFCTHFIEAATLRARTAGYQEPARRHAVARDR